MRRKISLYIADRLVDLDDQSLILFNYTMEDLLNPTIVKNSYSHQITIKGTPNNNRLFGDIFRLDRVVTYNGGTLGTDFNPSQKTPFVIYNEMNEILDREDYISEIYTFEVSSPGLTRPLKKEKDYTRNIDKPIEVHTYQAYNGEKFFVGNLKAFTEDMITLEIGDDILEIKRSDISKINQAFVD